MAWDSRMISSKTGTGLADEIQQLCRGHNTRVGDRVATYLRQKFPADHRAKMIARHFGVAVATAYQWLRGERPNVMFLDQMIYEWGLDFVSAVFDIRSGEHSNKDKLESFLPMKEIKTELISCKNDLDFVLQLWQEAEGRYSEKFINFIVEKNLSERTVIFTPTDNSFEDFKIDLLGRSAAPWINDFGKNQLEINTIKNSKNIGGPEYISKLSGFLSEIGKNKTPVLFRNKWQRANKVFHWDALRLPLVVDDSVFVVSVTKHLT
jgi:hypothetical protein